MSVIIGILVRSSESVRILANKKMTTKDMKSEDADDMLLPAKARNKKQIIKIHN